MGEKKIVALVVLGIVAIVVLADGWAIVPPGHRGVAVTLGKVQDDARPEGFTVKLPLLTGVRDMSVRQATSESEAQTFSSDLQTVVVKFNVLYRYPANRVVALFQQYEGDPYKTLVEPRCQEVLKQETAKFRAEDAVKSRDQIKREVLTRVREEIGDIIEIVDFVVNNVDLTDELEKSIEQKQIQEQLALAKAYEVQRAQRQAEITVIEAKAEAEAVKIKGEALRAAPSVIDLEIAKKWNGIAPLYVSTTDGGSNILLPLGTGDAGRKPK